MNPTTRQQQTLLLNAALDGELDAAGTLDMEARLAADPDLAAEYRQLVALRDAIGARLTRERAPDALRARIEAMAQPQAALRPQSPRRPKLWDASYRALAASLIVGMLVGGGVVHQLAPSAQEGQEGQANNIDRDVVAGFVRGRLSGQPVDVVTSDRHTVKPWLAGKIAGATTVVDLKGDGFALVGGRVDVFGQTPVATLIYQRREHQIALSETPLASAEGLGSGSGATDRRTLDGFSLLQWREGGRRFTAVSDLPPAELDAFGAAFRRAAAAEREEPSKP